MATIKVHFEARHPSNGFTPPPSRGQPREIAIHYQG
jgi:hypothetical protein